MFSAKINQDPLEFDRRVKELKEQVATLASRLAELERQNSLSPALLRLLGRSLGFGAAGKIDWVRFKLSFKREELGRFEADGEAQKLTAQSSGAAAESARQKMERLVEDTPQRPSGMSAPAGD
jgi:hypothetical protein